MQFCAENEMENVVSSSFFSKCSASVGQARAHTPQAVHDSEMVNMAKSKISRLIFAEGLFKCDTADNSRNLSRPGWRLKVVMPFSMARATETCPCRAIMRNRSRRES